MIREGISMFLLLAVCFMGSTQSEIDSLKQIWENDSEIDSVRYSAINQFYLENTYSFPDLVFPVTDLHLDLSKEKNHPLEMAKALNEKGICYAVKGDYYAAGAAFQNYIDLAAELNDSVGIGKGLNNMGSMNYHLENYHESIKFYRRSLEIHEAYGNELIQAQIFDNIGLIYSELELWDLALVYLNKALPLYEKTGKDNEIGNIWLNIAVVYLEQDRLDEAITNARKSLRILKTNYNRLTEADGYWLLTKIHLKRGRVDSALVNINKSLVINQSIGNEEKVLSNTVLKAEVLMETDIEKALELGLECLDKVKDLPTSSSKRSVYEFLYNCYRENGNSQEALNMNEQFLAINKTNKEKENKVLLAREALEHEFEEELIRTQHKNNEVNESLRNEHRGIFFFLIGMALFSAITVFFYFRRQKHKHKQQKNSLLKEIEELKKASEKSMAITSDGFHLNRQKIEEAIEKSMNETDWNVLNILSEDPVISNKEIAEKAFLSVDGIGSSLRRMYQTFDIKESKYKKISLIMNAIKISNR